MNNNETVMKTNDEVLILPREDNKGINPAKTAEAASKDKSFSTNGGVGVEARDVNADVKATVGVDKVDKSVNVGDNSTLTINNNNSKVVNKNRFDKALSMSLPDTPQADMGADFSK